MLWNGLSKTLVYSPWGKYPVYDVSRPKRARRQPHASVTRHTAPATPHPDGRTLEADACPALRRFSFHRIQTRCRPNDWPAHISACRCRTASHTATAQNGIHRCKRPAARTCCPRDFALWPPFWVARMPASSPLSELDTVDRRPSTVVRRPSSVLHHHHQSSTIFLPGHAVRAWSLGRNAGTRLILPMMCMLATPPRPPPPPPFLCFSPLHPVPRRVSAFLLHMWHPGGRECHQGTWTLCSIVLFGRTDPHEVSTVSSHNYRL